MCVCNVCYDYGEKALSSVCRAGGAGGAGGQQLLVLQRCSATEQADTAADKCSSNRLLLTIQPRSSTQTLWLLVALQLADSCIMVVP